MLEYRIIVPLADNSGESLAALHYDLQQELIEVFKGFTAIDAQGGWNNASGETIIEPVRIYIFSCYSGNFQREQNITIEKWLECRAKELCREARQDAIYIAIGSFSKIIEAA